MIPGSANSLLLASAAGAAQYQIERSLRFNSADSASLTQASYSGSGTFSAWVKRCKLSAAQTIISGVSFNASDQLNSSTAVFRDPSAWMHVVVSSLGTYVNNTSVASGSAITPSAIGSGCDLYLADIHFIDGQALDPTSFGEFDANGVWRPIEYTGTYGTNGFHLDFADNSAATTAGIGKDASGNGNDWTTNNLSVGGVLYSSYFDVLPVNSTYPFTSSYFSAYVNTSTGVITNTAWVGAYRSSGTVTWTPQAPIPVASSIDVYGGSYSNVAVSYTITVTYTDSSTSTFSGTSGSSNWVGRLSASVSGKSIQSISVAGSSFVQLNAVRVDGSFLVDSNPSDNDSLVDTPTSYGVDDGLGGSVRGNYATLNPLDGSPTGLSNGNLDAANANAYPTIFPGSGQWYYEVNGTGYQWDGTRANWTPRAGSHNFGQRTWASSAPSGYKALCTTNLPSTTITTSGSYTGNGVADGPFVYLNGVPTAMTVNGNAVTFSTEADKLSNGFKVRTTSTTYNQNAATYNYSITSTGDPFKVARAQSNP